MSGCECDDLPRCPVWEERTPKARKEYRCAECNGPIKVGEMHHYYFAVNEEKRADGWRVCNQCEVDWGLLQCYLSSECGRVHGEFSECLSKALEDDLLRDALEKELLPEKGAKVARPVWELLCRWRDKETLADELVGMIERGPNRILDEDENPYQVALREEQKWPHDLQPLSDLVREYCGEQGLTRILVNLELLPEDALPPVDAPGQLFLFKEGAP